MTGRLPKKILALLLTVCLILPTLSAAASAAETGTGRAEITGMTGDTAQSAVTEETALSEPVFQLDADCRILRYVDEAVFREAGHIARLNEEETLSTYVFLNRDGTKTVYYMDEEVKYLDSDGTVREKDLSLTAGLNGYTTAQNDISLTLPENLSEGVGLSYAGYDISLIPQSTTARVTGPQVNGNAVGYRNCFGNGTALVYTPTLSGLKEDIVLAACTGVSSFEFLLNTDGLGLYQEGGRYYLSASPTAELKIRLGDIVAFDATGSFSVGSMAVTTVTERQQYRLTVSVDPAFLTDPDTVYPVSIDPSITVSDNTHGAGAIEDASLYQGSPALNTGSWPYAHCGYVDSTYKVGRILVRPAGLLSDSTYQSVSASQIESAYFYIWETSGTSAQTINLYSLSGSAGWTESGVTWNNAGVTQGTQYASASPGPNAKASFNITSLVKAWKNNQVTANCGFMLISSNETSVDKAFCASEYETTSTRPYVVVNYNSTDGSLNYTSTDVDEGATKILTLSGVTGTVTWSSSNPAVATVNSSGVVTGVKAGLATITASASGYTPKTCVVYVTIPDGVYRICKGVLPIGTSGSNSGNGLYTQASTSSGTAQYNQMWKIAHIGSGRYTVRLMNNLSMGMCNSSGSVALQEIPLADSISVLPQYAIWNIAYNSSTSGYYLKSYSDTSKALTAANAGSYPGLSVMLGTYSSSVYSFNWLFNAAPGLFLHNSSTGTLYTDTVRRGFIPGESKTLNRLKLWLTISNPGGSQSVSWSSNTTSVATVNGTNGTITAQTYGESTITALSRIDGTIYRAQIQAIVSDLPVSGSEHIYDASSWNQSFVMSHTNCYAYALNNQMDPVNTAFGCNWVSPDETPGPKQQPGEFYNSNRGSLPQISTDGYWNDPSLLITAVQKDFEMYNSIFGTNLTFTSIRRYEVCPEGTYKIALAIDPDYPDYHWYRQDSDGFWSHKPGQTEVIRTDYSGALITDPQTADRGSYTLFVGYFAVSPWNHLYSGSADYGSANSLTFQSQTSAESLSVTDFEAVQIGMSLEEVIRILGTSGEDIGSGTVVYRYVAADGTSVIISYNMDSDCVFRVCQIFYGGGNCYE